MQSNLLFSLLFASGLTLSGPLQAQVCGNGIREGAEQCDDGNRASFDGCSSRCEFEQSQRINQLKLQNVTSTTCTANAFGGAFTTMGLQQFQTGIDASIADGSTSVLLYFIGLSDLSGTSVPNLRAGLFNALPEAPNANYNGTNDVDWWYAVDDTEMDTMQNPSNQVSGFIAGKVLDAQAPSFTLNLLLGTPAALSTSSLRFSVAIGSSSVPMTYDSVNDRGHLASENLDPVLQSFTAAGSTLGSLCGNVSAQSLADTLLSAGILSICSNYTNANSMLDLIVGGCTYLGILPVVKPTQPDTVDPGAPVAGAGGPYTLSASAAHVVNGCKDKNNSTVSLATCLNAAAYSAFFLFSTDRVIAKSASASDVIFYDGFQ